MQAALEQARIGYAEGGVPIGCVLVKDDAIVGAGHNRRVQHDSAILHGEMDALEATGRRPALVEGRADNIKITLPEDLALARFYLGTQEEEGLAW